MPHHFHTLIVAMMAMLPNLKGWALPVGRNAICVMYCLISSPHMHAGMVVSASEHALRPRNFTV